MESSEESNIANLPTVLLLEIGKSSPEVWGTLVSSVPKVGRWSLDKDYQNYIRDYFV